MNKKYDEKFMLEVLLLSTYSKCKKRKVAAVFVKDNRVIIDGYNGTPPGATNDCEETKIVCEKCGVVGNINDLGKKHCDVKTFPSRFVKKSFTHEYTLCAEDNCITKANDLGISLRGTTLYITYFPCMKCASKLETLGVEEIVYLEEPTKIDEVEWVKSLNLNVRKFEFNKAIFDKAVELLAVLTNSYSNNRRRY